MKGLILLYIGHVQPLPREAGRGAPRPMAEAGHVLFDLMVRINTKKNRTLVNDPIKAKNDQILNWQYL